MKFPKLRGKALLAPMEGVTDVAFRLLCRNYGAAMCYTEMVSAHALARMNNATLRRVETAEEERPVGIQLMGQNTAHIVKAAEFIKENRLADLVDFNIGCPAAKIVRQGAGSALLKRPNRIKEILDGLCGVGIPITVKTRIGVKKNNANIAKIARMCEDSGVCAITVHARSQKQGYTGKADWSYIKLVKESVSMPVIGNGDIWVPEDAKRMLDETGCDYVMIGRAAMGNPRVFRQCNDYLEKGSYEKSEKSMSPFLEYLKIAQDRDIDFVKLKSQAIYFTKGIYGSAKMRLAISKAKAINEILNIVENIDG